MPSRGELTEVNKMKFKIPKTEPKNDQPETTWVKWYDGLSADSPFTFEATRVVFKESPSPVFYIFNEDENTGFSLYCEHAENAKFKDATPEGVRFVNAVARAAKLSGEVSGEMIADAINTLDGVAASITCTKTEKGRLWSVNLG